MSQPSAALDASAVYISPRGKRCRWLPLGGAKGHYTSYAFFEYLDQRGLSDRAGFNLTAENFHLLRKEQPRAAAR